MKKISCLMIRKRPSILSLYHIYLLSLPAVLLLLPFSAARPWPSPRLYLTDPAKDVMIKEREDAFRFTNHPSLQPTDTPSTSIHPTVTPSNRPSLSMKPSVKPTRMPSSGPSSSPTTRPSFFPTTEPSEEPSYLPTTAPSEEPSFLHTTAPSEEPSFLHTAVPSEEKSLHPTNIPTSHPSLSSNPSVVPTMANGPSFIPSLSPTVRPTEESMTRSPVQQYPIDVPNVTEGNSKHSTKSYFNYNPYDVNFGPGIAVKLVHDYNMTNPDNKNETFTKEMNYTFYNGNRWSSVRDSYEYNYWKGFEGMNRTVGNKCEGGPTKQQSPIDLCETQVNAECHEHHQIRNRGGSYNLNDTHVQLKILPSKLRIEYTRENKHFDADIQNEDDQSPYELSPPRADFAHNWNGYIPVVHIDVKIPSEHTICGRRYAGEYQIYFYHVKRRLPIVQSVLIEIHPRNKRHKHFQKVLNEWQAIADGRKMECMEKEREAKEMEKRFVRRMENYIMTGLDSDEVSLVVSEDGPKPESHHRSGPSHDEESNIYQDNKSRDLGMSEMLDEPREEREKFQELVKKAKDRANNPVFDLSYEGLNIATKHKGRDNVRRAKKKQVSFAPAASETDPSLRMAATAPPPSISESPSHIPSAMPSNTSNQPSSTTSHRSSAIPSETQAPSSPPSSTRVSRPKWNPFRPRIVNSIYFYGYRGSLTEPPCSEWVSWRVLDKPMQISMQQWMQMRDILFGQVDGDCKRTSVHWKGSVARPTQSFNNRPLWKCIPKDYLSDVEKAKKQKKKSKSS